MLIGGGILAAAAAVAVAIWLGHRPMPAQRTDARSAATSRPAPVKLEPPQARPWPPIPDDTPKVGMLITGPEWIPGPQFGPPYAPGPQFRPYAGASSGDYVQRMEREHGANRVVHVYIDGVAEGQKDALVARLRELTGASSSFVSGNKQSISVHLAPVRDLAEFAKKIDFGKVTSIDPNKRAIEVLYGPEK
jgi:hypothetical protein